uniref:Ribosomal protein L21a n=1 Tax=Lotharella vacuolata TaxID=74820 RepID=A0A0H5BQR7_9EUKA|nr:ribosomal protein L21a [Lotharella vacuolata]
MPKNKGARARTRKLFSKNRIQKKENNSQIRKIKYKLNELVVIKPDSAYQKVFYYNLKNLPNKWYFGKYGYIIGTIRSKVKVALKKKIKNKKFFKTIILDKMHIRHVNTKLR